MKYLSAFLSVITVLFWSTQAPSCAGDAAKAVVTPGHGQVSAIPYKTYKNDRFGYQLNYPAEILIPQGESDNGDGQKFLTKSGDAELAVWGNYQVAGDLHYELKLAKEPGEKGQPQRKISYEAGGKDWFAVSGTAGDKIFYQKTCLRGDTFRTVKFLYPEALKEKFSQVVDNVVGTFKWSHK